eukprot:g3883.t1
MSLALELLASRQIVLRKHPTRSHRHRPRCTTKTHSSSSRVLESPVVTDLHKSVVSSGNYIEQLHLLPVCYDLKLVTERLTYDEEEEKDVQSQEEPPNDYYANFGKAIETIKHDFPRLFQKDFDYSIFRDDLIFKDPINSFQGKKFYKYMMLSLRWHGKVFFKRVYVRIHNLHPRTDGSIKVRWSMHGVPRIPWDAEEEGVFDGVSEYQLDRHGKIYEHSVDNIIFRDPPVFNLPIFFAQLSTANTVSTPIPSVCFQAEESKDGSVMSCFSWVRLYFVLSVVLSILQVHDQKEMNVAI